MRSIRIGNDICLNMTIEGGSKFDKTSIKQLQCYLINTDNDSVGKCDNDHGHPQYAPSEYTLATCGHGHYHVYPKNVYDHHVQLKYLAPSEVGEKENEIRCYFPAVDLRYLGTYKLVVVLIVHQTGWGENNLRTYSIDYGSAFKLVDDETGESGGITIKIDGMEKPNVPPVEPDDPVTPDTSSKYKAGFSFANTLEEFLATYPVVMNEYTWVSGKILTINNPSEGLGAYIWVITQKPIVTLMGQFATCPYEECGSYENKYYYKSINEMDEGENHIKIVY